MDRTTTVSKILLAYDGSEAASDAAHVAAGMALRHGAKVIVLKVGRIMEVLDAVLYPTMEEEVHYWIAEMGAGLIRDLGGVAEARMEWGEPAEKIVELAEQERVDLIIVGHNPLSGLRRLLHGRSTASKVMDHASCPVLVVRQSKDLLDGDALDEKGLNG